MTPRTYLLIKDGDGTLAVFSGRMFYYALGPLDRVEWFPEEGPAVEVNALHESWADALRPHFADLPNGSVKAVTLDGELADHLDEVMT